MKPMLRFLPIAAFLFVGSSLMLLPNAIQAAPPSEEMLPAEVDALVAHLLERSPDFHEDFEDDMRRWERVSLQEAAGDEYTFERADGVFRMGRTLPEPVVWTLTDEGVNDLLVGDTYVQVTVTPRYGEVNPAGIVHRYVSAQDFAYVVAVDDPGQGGLSVAVGGWSEEGEVGAQGVGNVGREDERYQPYTVGVLSRGAYEYYLVNGVAVERGPRAPGELSGVGLVTLLTGGEVAFDDLQLWQLNENDIVESAAVESDDVEADAVAIQAPSAAPPSAPPSVPPVASRNPTVEADTEADTEADAEPDVARPVPEAEIAPEAETEPQSAGSTQDTLANLLESGEAGLFRLTEPCEFESISMESISTMSAGPEDRNPLVQRNSASEEEAAAAVTRALASLNFRVEDEQVRVELASDDSLREAEIKASDENITVRFDATWTMSGNQSETHFEGTLEGDRMRGSYYSFSGGAVVTEFGGVSESVSMIAEFDCATAFLPREQWPPLMPQDLRGVALADDRIRLTWAAQEGVESYRIYAYYTTLDVADVEFSLIAELEGDAVEYVDTVPASVFGVGYYMEAVNAAGEASKSTPLVYVELGMPDLFPIP